MDCQKDLQVKHFSWWRAIQGPPMSLLGQLGEGNHLAWGLDAVGRLLAEEGGCSLCLFYHVDGIYCKFTPSQKEQSN